jgi:hypothetical protein
MYISMFRTKCLALPKLHVNKYIGLRITTSHVKNKTSIDCLSVKIVHPIFVIFLNESSLSNDISIATSA